jgi:hypothetical protein
MMIERLKRIHWTRMARVIDWIPKLASDASDLIRRNASTESKSDENEAE